MKPLLETTRALSRSKFISPIYKITPKRPFSRRLISTTRSIKNVQKKNLPPIPKPSAALIKTNAQPFYKRTIKSILKFTAISTLLATTYLTYSVYTEFHPKKQIPQADKFANGAPKKTTIILGSGWGAVSLLKNLDTTLYNVIVISPRNYFLFTPFLPSTPVGTIDLKSIVEPVRSIARRSKGEVIYVEGEAVNIDPKNQTVSVKEISSLNDEDDEERIRKLDLKFDYLVVAVGSQPTTFGVPGVLEHGSFLKEISDARDIRLKILNNIEVANNLPKDDPLRAKLLKFVVVGGGPTGVEFAAELKDYVSEDLAAAMPEISKEIKLTLIEGAPNILNSFNKSLVEYAQDVFAKSRIELKLKTQVKEVTKDYILAKNGGGEIEEIPYGVLVWATGNAPRDVTKKLMTSLPEQQNSRRGLLINDKLQLLGAEGSIYAIGDCTFHPGLFPTAQVAHQEAVYLADVFTKLNKIDQLNWKVQGEKQHEMTSKNDIKPLTKNVQKLPSTIEDFKYNHLGALAYIGSEKAIADLSLGSSKYYSTGSFTFLFYKSAYLAMCLSFRNRILVALDWLKVSLLGRDSSI
ncbi:NADH-ubiquinone reductase (H(+)-translocating) NDE1 NDAI_0H03010 [Naumovozyma dairenensis CBS 421]|uniref:NADH:ubiquinone reductase (non-electrogenic) n=1 Tax=Naumovozyma dairenensis (strain ATCC 10597 / BCRC 20456 / CBS 421 / NBRC 0211 / NRRL Y-12639) TaxID=1071378 RepID=G0WFB3_NAUDC|nr:hypothetical protein NDAI_0H03010 [Naumovozyma dairenensis CBS 421]CCD26474.1 hypothetical protein NDAI_0H03010 [Naumovozyma dairenensis CBS 421]